MYIEILLHLYFGNRCTALVSGVEIVDHLILYDVQAMFKPNQHGLYPLYSVGFCLFYFVTGCMQFLFSFMVYFNTNHVMHIEINCVILDPYPIHVLVIGLPSSASRRTR